MKNSQNLPWVWVHRSPQRKKYCRGPILAYWPPCELSAHEFLLKRNKPKKERKKEREKGKRPTQWIIQCPFYFVAMYCFRAKKPPKPNSIISAAERTRPHPACPFSFPLSGSAPVKRAVCLSTRRHVRGDFCSHQLQNEKKKTTITDAQRRSPRCISSLWHFTGSRRGGTHPSWRGTSWEMKEWRGGEKGGDGWVGGNQSEVSSCTVQQQQQ